MPTSDACVVLCTAPDEASARALAKGLIEGRLAACVNVIAGVQSFYRWEGKVEDAQEFQLVAKTTRERSALVLEWLAEAHPYDVPELIVLPITGGSASYLAWIGAEVAT